MVLEVHCIAIKAVAFAGTFDHLRCSFFSALTVVSFAQAASSGRRVVLAFADHSNLQSNPGWQLRNALLMSAARWRVPDLDVACLRLRRGLVDAAASLLLSVSLPHIPEGTFQVAVPDRLSTCHVY